MPTETQIKYARQFYNNWSDEKLLDRIAMHEEAAVDLGNMKRIDRTLAESIAKHKSIAEVTTIILDERLNSC
jgi:hypothetical protein